VHKVRYV